jgi:hypothetical protein
MEIIAQNGQVVYRTRCLEIEQAAWFAKCLGANPRFTGIEIAESSRAKGERRWFVAFAPANEERQAAMVERQQTAREERAAARQYTFCLDKNSGRALFWCHSHHSGEVYEVTERTYSCPDHQLRCSRAGLRCSHQIALAAAIDRGEIRRF